MKLKDVKEYWEEAGKRFPIGKRVTPTSRDPYLGKLEQEDILNYLNKGADVLEIGCGDATHSIRYAGCVKSISGIDIADSLIAIARRNVKSEKVQNVDFEVGSALDIEKLYRSRRFGCVISQRLIINLPEWSFQKKVILQVHRCLMKRGLFLIAEAFQEELINLNMIRRKLGLSEIKVVDYNRFMMRREFEDYVSKYFEIVEMRSYGAYLFFSRVFHPLVVYPNEPKHDSKLNEVAMEVSRKVQAAGFEKYGYHSFYALRKK